MGGDSDRAFNELFQEVQQQFLWYKKKSNERFQELEDKLTLAAQQVEIIQRKRAKKVKFENSFADRNIPASQTLELLPHLKLQFPKFKEGTEVCDWLQDCEQYFTIYNIEDPLKVVVAGMHLEGTSRNWFQAEGVSWEWTGFCQQITKRFGALFNEEAWCDMDTEASITTEEEEVVYDEVPGGDREDWHCEELLCKALGLEDFFEPKQDFGESNSIVAKVLKCIPDVSIPSASKLQVPHDWNTPHHWINQEVDSSDTYNRRTGVAQLHLPNEILVNYNNKSDEAKGVMQFLVADEQPETLKAKVALVLGVQTLDEDDISGKLSQGQVELLGIDCMVDCSLKTKLFDKSLKIKSDLVTENEFGDELLNSINSVEEGAMKLWSLTAAISYCFDNMSCNFGENDRLIFDPGGHSQNAQQRGVVDMTTSLLRNKKVKLGETAKITSLSGQLGQVPERINLMLLAIEYLLMGHPKLRKAYLGQTVKQATFQSHEVHHEADNNVGGIIRKYVDHVRVKTKELTYKYKSIVLRQCYPELDMVMTHEYQETSKRRAIITVFDPGGDICHVAEVTRSDVLKGKKLHINQKEVCASLL